MICTFEVVKDPVDTWLYSVTASGITGYTRWELLKLFIGSEPDSTAPYDGPILLSGDIVSGGFNVKYNNKTSGLIFLSTPTGGRSFAFGTHNRHYSTEDNDRHFIYFDTSNVFKTALLYPPKTFQVFIPDPPVSAINLSLQNNSTVQQIKYKVGAGAETTLNAGASAQISNLGNGAVLGVNPILSARPITFNSNGRIASVGYNGVNYTQFPTNINVDVSGTPSIMLNGTQAPTVTVNYSNTNEPVITNT